MQQVYSGKNEMDAHFLKGILCEQGIGAVVEGEALGQVWGTLPLSQTSLPSVWVPDDKVEQARPIVEEYNRRHIQNSDRPDDLKAATWVCPRCGQVLEDQFTQCWKCGTARPSPAAPNAT